MKQKILLGIFFCYSFNLAFSQTLLLRDEGTNKPIADVFVFHENQEDLGYSNSDGFVDLSTFPKGLLFIQHPSYNRQSVAYLGSSIEIMLAEKIINFNEVVISANKWEQESESVSQEILSIDKKSVAFQNPQTSADLLAHSGQVFVQKSQLGGGSPKLRGFAANSVLLVVDGVRMNNAIFRSGNLQNVISVDPNVVESAEVIMGPGSVIYGSDALGGVMDFHTIEPRHSIDAKAILSVNQFFRYSSAANERTGHIDLSVASKKLSFFQSFSVSEFDDLEAGSNRSPGYMGSFERNFFVGQINDEDQLIANPNPDLQKFSGYGLFNSLSKIKIRLNDKWDVGYSYFYSTSTDIPRYDNLTETIDATDSLLAAEWYYGPQKWQMHSIKANYVDNRLLFDQVRIITAYQKFEESRNDRQFGDDRLRTRLEEVDMYSVSFDFDKELGKSNLYYGLDFFHNDVNSIAFRRNILTNVVSETEPRYPNAGSSYASYALYSSLTHKLTDKVVINSGIRLNHVNIQASSTDSTALSVEAANLSIDNTSVNGSLGITWNPNETYKLSYNLSTGFRSPNIDDIGKLFEVGNSIVVPNSNLKPEYVVTQEVSFERKNDFFRFRITGFYSRLFDAIVDGPFELNGLSQLNGLDVFSKVNSDEAEIYGGSFILQAEISEQFALQKTLAITDGRDLSNNQPLRHASPWFGRMNLIYKSGKIRTETYIEYNGNKDGSDIPIAEIERKPYLYTPEGTPGWYTLNIKASYQLNQVLMANLGVENILDVHYRPYTSGISAPGRNYIITLRANI